MTVQADTNASAGYSNIPFTRGIVTSRDPRRQSGVYYLPNYHEGGGDAYFRPPT